MGASEKALKGPWRIRGDCRGMLACTEMVFGLC